MCTHHCGRLQEDVIRSKDIVEKIEFSGKAQLLIQTRSVLIMRHVVSAGTADGGCTAEVNGCLMRSGTKGASIDCTHTP
jgi:hypothetical protein